MLLKVRDELNMLVDSLFLILILHELSWRLSNNSGPILRMIGWCAVYHCRFYCFKARSHIEVGILGVSKLDKLVSLGSKSMILFCAFQWKAVDYYCRWKKKVEVNFQGGSNFALLCMHRFCNAYLRGDTLLCDALFIIFICSTTGR